MSVLVARFLTFAKGTGKVGKFILSDRVIGWATNALTDIPMLYFILSDPVFGWLKCMVFVTPLYVLICAVIVAFCDYFSRKGIDVTGIEEMRAIKHEALEKRQIFKRFIRWFMHRESLIFWIGSCIHLDPDYVTLMLRKKEDSFLKTTIMLTLPSVVVSMLYWTTIYWLVYQLFKNTEWAKWLAERI